MAEKRKRHGCLVFFLVVIALLFGAGYGVWNTVLNRGPNPEAMKIIEGPADTVASQLLTEGLTATAGAGITAVVVPLPDGSGTGAVIVIDPSAGFVPASGVEGKRKQAMDSIRKIIDSNTQSSLGLKAVSLSYQEGGKSIISLASPMGNLEALASGSLSETQFAAKMGLEVNNLMYFKDLIGN